jgi:hypothetical protein
MKSDPIQMGGRTRGRVNEWGERDRWVEMGNKTEIALANGSTCTDEGWTDGWMNRWMGKRKYADRWVDKRRKRDRVRLAGRDRDGFERGSAG